MIWKIEWYCLLNFKIIELLILFIDIGLWLDLSGIFVIIVLDLVFFELDSDFFIFLWFFFCDFERDWDLFVGILI